MTPNYVHYGQTEAGHAARKTTLDAVFAAHPERYVKKPPSPPKTPTTVWINPPQNKASTSTLK